jgi:hypothetical protein
MSGRVMVRCGSEILNIGVNGVRGRSAITYAPWFMLSFSKRSSYLPYRGWVTLRSMLPGTTKTELKEIEGAKGRISNRRIP